MSSTVEDTSFTYKTLHESDAFRLIQLQPSQSTVSQIECTLLHRTLSVCDRDIIDHYTALSYVWGDPSQTAQIFVDGCPVTITATLEAALRDLRDSSRVLWVWADALCIDQSNVEERNQQVRQMGRIYSTAHHTVIYLGSSVPEVETVLEVTPSRSSGRWVNLDAEALLRITQTAENSLLRRPWFTRVWVFQELVLSKDPWVQCGKARVRWTDLCSLLLSSNSKRDGLKLLTEMHYARERRIQTDMFNLLLSRRGLGATDARDLIFSHMGVASDRATLAENVRIDYQQSCERLYEDVAQYFIDSVGPETLFFHVGDINRSQRRQGLASWAPDWSLLPSSVTPMHKDNRMSTVSFKPKPHYIFLQEPRLLAYIGYKVDVISTVSHGIDSISQSKLANRPRYQEAVRDLQALYAKVGGSYASGDQDGQYTHINLVGRESDHERLCLEICEEWLELCDKELPEISPSVTAEDLESHRRFREMFKAWLTEQAKRRVIFVGGDAEGILSILYYHLHPNPPPSVLNGRKLAGMESGRVGVVPAQAREGDIVIYLAGNPTSQIIRPTEAVHPELVNEAIFDKFKNKDADLRASKSPYIEAFLQLLKEASECIEHADLVGECFVHGIVGWSRREQHDHHDFKIFAIH